MVFEAILDRVALFNDEEKVDVNIDATGLVVYGDKYQFVQKGYFPNKRDKKGYQLSLGTTNCEYGQILSVILDLGNIPLNMRLWDTIYEVAEVLGSLDRIGIIRADAIYRMESDIARLIEENYPFSLRTKILELLKEFLRD